MDALHTKEIRRINQLALEITIKKERECRACQARARFNRHGSEYPDDQAVRDVLQNEQGMGAASLALLINRLDETGNCGIALGALKWATETNGPPSSTLVYDAAITSCCRWYKWKQALQVFQEMRQHGLRPETHTYNMAIAACSNAGAMEEALMIFDDMVDCGVRPNSFTFLNLVQGCNFKKRGDCERALASFQKLEDFEIDPPEVLCQALWGVCKTAMQKAKRWQDAMKVFVGLQTIGMEDDVGVLTCLVEACSRDRCSGKALDVFHHMRNIGVAANTSTYNALIDACVRNGQDDLAFQIFDWMIEGVGNEGPTPANSKTYNALIRACHQKGHLERALEVMAWMVNADIELEQETFDGLINTVEIAEIWDAKAIKTATKGWTVITPDRLRPGLFDGMRMLYTERAEEIMEEKLLAREKLAMEGWAPVCMRAAVTEKEPGAGAQLHDVTEAGGCFGGAITAEYAARFPSFSIPAAQKRPNALHWKNIGSSTK